MRNAAIPHADHFGGSLAGLLLGKLLEQSWGWYFYFMAPLGLIDGVLMMSTFGNVTLAKSTR